MASRIPKNVNEIKDVLRQEGLYLIENDEDLDRALDVMVDFYDGDALFTWFCGGEYDKRTTRNILRSGICSMQNTIVYADSEEINAVAAWIPPGNRSISVIPYLKNGGFELYRDKGLSIARRLLRYQGYASRMRKNITGKRDWFLFAYAVDPGKDVNEYSQKILRPVTRYGWEQGEACYSEVNSDRGISFMRAAGFQVRDQGKVPGGRINHYGVMV